MKKFLTIIAAVLLSVSCSTDEEKGSGGYQPSGDPIRFEATTGGAFTRAVNGEIVDDASFQGLTFENHPSANTNPRGFGVFAAYTGQLKYENTTVSADYMYNQQVCYNNTAAVWEYNPVKYWPNETNDYVSFFAYAPYEPSPDDDGRCIIDISKNTDFGDPWVNYRLSKDPWGTDGNNATETQVDLMYAFNNTGTDAAKWYDQTKNAGTKIDYDDKLKFTFNHALGCFAHEVTLQLNNDLREKLKGYATITINSFNITYNNLTNKARLILNPEISGTKAYANWKEIISGELTVSRTTGNIDKYPTSDGEKSLNDVDPAKALSFDLEKTEAQEPPQMISTDRGLLYIPIIIAGQPKPTVTVTLNYTITNNASTSYTGSVSKVIDLSDYHKETYQGQKIGLALTLTKDLDLAHLVYTIDSTSASATEPSYIRKR